MWLRAMMFFPERSSVMECSGSSSFTGFWGIGSPASIWAALSIAAAAECAACATFARTEAMFIGTDGICR